MFCRINFVRVPHEGWMKNDSSFVQKWMKFVSLTLTLFPISLDGFSPFSPFSACPLPPLNSTHLFNVGVYVICMLPLPYSPMCSISLFCDLFATPSIQLPSLITPSSLIMQSQHLLGRFLHSRKCVVDIFSMVSRCCQDLVALSLAKLVCMHSYILRLHPSSLCMRQGEFGSLAISHSLSTKHSEKIRIQSSTLKHGKIVGLNLFLRQITVGNATNILNIVMLVYGG